MNFLHKKLNIVYLPERVVAKYAAQMNEEIPSGKTGLLNLLTRYPVKDPAHFEIFSSAAGTDYTKALFHLFLS